MLPVRVMQYMRALSRWQGEPLWSQNSTRKFPAVHGHSGAEMAPRLAGGLCGSSCAASKGRCPALVSGVQQQQFSAADGALYFEIRVYQGQVGELACCQLAHGGFQTNGPCGVDGCHTAHGIGRQATGQRVDDSLFHRQRRATQGAIEIAALTVLTIDTVPAQHERLQCGAGGRRTIGHQQESILHEAMRQAQVLPGQMVAIGDNAGAQCLTFQNGTDDTRLTTGQRAHGIVQMGCHTDTCLFGRLDLGAGGVCVSDGDNNAMGAECLYHAGRTDLGRQGDHADHIAVTTQEINGGRGWLAQDPGVMDALAIRIDVGTFQVESRNPVRMTVPVVAYHLDRLGHGLVVAGDKCGQKSCTACPEVGAVHGIQGGSIQGLTEKDAATSIELQIYIAGKNSQGIEVNLRAVGWYVFSGDNGLYPGITHNKSKVCIVIFFGEQEVTLPKKATVDHCVVMIALSFFCMHGNGLRGRAIGR